MHNSGAMLADQEIYQRLASKLPDPKASNSLHVCLLCNAAAAVSTGTSECWLTRRLSTGWPAVYQA